MPKIDFYIIQESGPKNRFDFTCRLIEKAYKNRHRIYIHTENQADAHTLDELLWTYRDDSFLPHNLVGEGPEPSPPIQIGYQLKPQSQRDILINLSHLVPEFYQQFARVIEVVSHDEAIQVISREHYRTYRSNGFDITTHNINLKIDA
jgi:DNA polymerase-3 subunit chi